MTPLLLIPALAAVGLVLFWRGAHRFRDMPGDHIDWTR